jgi:MFS superfamily sulfate permease-like transporter
MISVVAYSLVEGRVRTPFAMSTANPVPECPDDIKFFIRIRGFSELVLMFLIFASTIFYSLTVGVALGVGLSLLSVIKHATKPRIQILGKVPDTADRFENAEDNPNGVEFIKGCLIIKIPEPLTFANTGDLKNRLRRLEFYGSTTAHPALPRVRGQEHSKNIVFDVHGVTSLDGSGTQVLTEIVDEYVGRGVRVWFCRVPHPDSGVYRNFERSGIVARCGGADHFVRSVDEALKMAESEDIEQWYEDHPAVPREQNV